MFYDESLGRLFAPLCLFPWQMMPSWQFGALPTQKISTKVIQSVQSSPHAELAFKSRVTFQEKAMAPHSSTLAWKIPWTEEPGRLQSMGRWESDTTGQLHFPFSLWCIGEGHGNPLQCSCLENPRDRGAWWAAVYGVAQNRTRMKWLSSSSNVLTEWLSESDGSPLSGHEMGSS